ncbi:hypothetical protein B0T21DRAFT_381738 [Apiosordaria backusii]|uniref:Uncharacterized protein n=1 Tax=Apiosordaria backusii TaxID=314023 RepID=A0AA40EME1_9PEZI|nr:hypothetical protein B0T21DRAFT_381738 [Apiosordaria backusii]
MSRPGGHDWGGNPPPTGPRARKRRAGDASEHWVRPESQSYRPGPRPPSPKRHRPEPPIGSESSPPRYGESPYHNGIAIKGSAVGARHHSLEIDEDTDLGPPAQLGDYQVRRQSSANMSSMEESSTGGGEMVGREFQERMPFPNYFPEAAGYITQQAKEELKGLEEFLQLPQLKNAQAIWEPLLERICNELDRIETFCSYINAQRRALHGEKMENKRQVSKFEKDYRTQIADMEGFKKSIARLEKETETHKKQAGKLEKETEAYKKQVSKLEGDNKQQVAEAEGYKKKISELEEELEKQVAETETYKQKADKLEEDCSKQAAETEGYKKQAGKLAEENNKKAAEMEGYKKQISELEKDKKSSTVGLEGGQSQVRELKGGKIPVVGPEDYQSQIRQLEDNHRNRTSKMPKAPKDWSMEAGDKTPKGPKDRSREMGGYKAQIRELEETCNNQSAQIQGLQMDLGTWQQESWNQGVEKEGYKLEIGQLQQDIGRLQQELDNAASQRAKHVAKLRQLEQKLAGVSKKKDVRSELLRVQDEKQKLELGAAEEQKKYTAMRADYEAQLTKVRNLERDAADQKKKFTTIRVEYQRSIDKIKAEKEKLERQVREGQKTPNGDCQLSPTDCEASAPDIDELMGDMEPIIPPAGASKKSSEPLAGSDQRPDADRLIGGMEPTTSFVSSSKQSVEPHVTTAGTSVADAGTRVLSTPAQPSRAKTGSAQDDTQRGAENGRQEIMRYQAMLREKDERLKQVTAEKIELQSLFDEKVTQIEKHLQAEKNRLQQQAQGLDDKRGSAAINDILKTRVDKLLLKDKEKDTNLKQLKEVNFQLECQVEQLQGQIQTKVDSFKQFAAVNITLEGMIQEKTGIVQKLEDEKNQLQGDIQARDDQIRALEVKIGETENQLREEVEKTTKLHQIITHKEAEISTLRAASLLPDTPLSAVSSRSFQNHIDRATSSEGTHGNNGSSLSAQREPTVFIKRERPDPGCESLESSPPPLAISQETREQDQGLRDGIISLLANLFGVTPGQNIDTIVKYVSCFGAGSNNITADVAPIDDAWKLKNVWAQDSSPEQPHLQDMTTAARFAHLCLLLSSVRDGQNNDISTCQFMGELALHLLSADQSQLPLAGMAFLGCMTSSQGTAKPERVKAREGLMAILVCELCRYLERVFPEAPKSHWGIKEVLGKTEDEAAETSTIWKLATILAEEDTRSDPLEIRKRLAQTCGDLFSFFYETDENGKDHEIGLLSCGSGSGTEDGANSQIFLMLDFDQRSIRLVDCGLAYFTSNRAAPRMLDLVIARESADKREEVLFKIEAAPKDVAAFWLKHICYGS